MPQLVTPSSSSSSSSGGGGEAGGGGGGLHVGTAPGGGGGGRAGAGGCGCDHRFPDGEVIHPVPANGREMRRLGRGEGQGRRWGGVGPQGHHASNQKKEGGKKTPKRMHAPKFFFKKIEAGEKQGAEPMCEHGPRPARQRDKRKAKGAPPPPPLFSNSRHRLHQVRHQGAGAVDEFRELVDLCQVSRAQQLLHPCRRLLPIRQGQLDLQHRCTEGGGAFRC